jgi:uncharacterized tellurite resistance protein B-like protein
MPNVALIPALAKTLIAIAWADGEIHPEEETTLKEVLGLLPPMSAQAWAVIELYLAVPVLPAERAELIAHASAHIRTVADKALALESVDNIIQADGVVHDEEDAVAHEVRDAFAAVDVSLFAQLGRGIAGVFQPRPSREANLELWRANPIAYYLRALDNNSDADTDRPEVAVAALAAGIMAQVVRITPTSAERERPVLVAALQADWGVSPAQAAQIADAALVLSRRDIDYHRLSRELVARTEEAQRVRLLDTLFTIANTADRVSADEIDAIRVIGNRLNLTHQQFIAAKLKIAPEDRRGL